MDVARLSTDVETKANLIERAEERLRYIDQALGRLERGNYGTCAECGESIPIERLMAVPFAIYCVDCQQKRQTSRFRGEGAHDAGGRAAMGRAGRGCGTSPASESRR